MKPQEKDLGRLVAVYGIAAIHVQRAVFMAVLSFMFFLAMMFAFYILQSGLYFLLSTAFLIIYLLTMFSFVMQRKKHFEIFEHGFRYKKQNVLWQEIMEVDHAGTISLRNGKPITVPKTINDFERLLGLIRLNSKKTTNEVQIHTRF